MFAWLVGIVCAGVVAALGFLAQPLLPHTGSWIAAGLGSLTGTDAATAPDDPDTAREATPDAPVGATDRCRDLYADALWTTLRMAGGAELTASTDAPALSAPELVDALAPQPTVTCAWASDRGSIATTVATVPPDAAAIAEASLSGSGFACESHRDRMRCTRSDGALTETVEIGGGVWLSSVQEGWHPAGYSERTAERVWGTR